MIGDYSANSLPSAYLHRETGDGRTQIIVDHHGLCNYYMPANHTWNSSSVNVENSALHVSVHLKTYDTQTSTVAKDIATIIENICTSYNCMRTVIFMWTGHLLHELQFTFLIN